MTVVPITTSSAQIEQAKQEPTQTKRVRLYVCPTPGCPDYYGSTTMAILEEEWTGVKIEDRHQTGISVYADAPKGMRHPRAECPTCRKAGKHVMRLPVEAIVVVPMPELPPAA